MRIAMPTIKGRIHPVFHRADEYTIYDIEVESVQTKTIYPIGSKETLGGFLTDEAINGVICGKIHSTDRNILRLKRVELNYGVSGEADDIMVRYLSGERLGDIEENAFWHENVERMD